MLIQSTTESNTDSWFISGFGRWVLAQEQRYCNSMMRDTFGFFALQLGLTLRPMTKRAPVRNHAIIGSANAHIAADGTALPFANDSVDFILLQHALESAAAPHAVLRETVRVLHPEGRLLIVGFNPFSLLGATAGLAGLPWRGRWLSLRRIKDWLALLDMEVTEGRFAVFLPPLHRRKARWRLGWMEKAGRRWWPLCGGVYFISAVKRRLGMRMIMPNFNKRRLPQQLPIAENKQRTHE